MQNLKQGPWSTKSVGGSSEVTLGLKTPEKTPSFCLFSADRTATKTWRVQMTCVTTFNVDSESGKGLSFPEEGWQESWGHR